MDRREEILSRLFEIIESRKEPPFSEYVTVERNAGQRRNDQRPACVLLDGSERAEVTARSSGRMGMFRTQLMRMDPRIYILVKEDRPMNENVGQALNSLRLSLLRAIASDALLKNLITANGRLVLDAVDTDLNTGMSMSGEMELALSIIYPFNPIE